MIGELVGARYRVINVLASGGFGSTYIAEDTQRPGNPRCVLKHLTFSSQDPAVLQQVRRLFQAEAETLEQLGKHDQIPRLLAYFEENHQFYLVQEFIEGHPLNEELIKGTPLSEEEVIPILEDVLGVLEYVHAQGVIHRDIKPANLIRRRQDSKLVLIDFGAVKLIGNTVAEATGETALSMPVYTTGYAASEQCMGRPRFSSDLYALGMVGIQALTGLHPAQLPHDYASSEVVWRDQATVSDGLAEVLSQMTRYHFNERYPSASDALHALRQVIATAPTLLTNRTLLSAPPSAGITRLSSSAVGSLHPQESSISRFRPPASRTLTRIGLAIAGTLTLAILVRTLTDFGFQSPLPIPSVTDPLVVLRDSDRVSAGEKALIKWQIDPQKQEGIDDIAAGNYSRAIPVLESARQRLPDDPELLIYLNNARIGEDKSHAISVVTPISSNSLASALELLRGVAHAQDEINRNGGINGVPLKVFIADDSNRPEMAEQLAKKLADQPSVLGVIGHGTSDTSYVAGKIYQERRTVMVAPVSSAVALSDIGDYIFRTMPSDKQTANALKDYLLTRLNKRKVVVFHNSNSKYSQSLKEEFKRALIYSGKGARVVEEIDLARPDFDPEASVNQAIAKGAEALMLAPDNEVMDRAIRVVEATNRKLPILAGDSMFNHNLLRLGKAAAVGIVLAVPVDLTQSPFHQTAGTMWGNPDLASWRTALAYDATQALATAIAQNPSRNGIRRSLGQADFEAKGAKGSVNFRPEGDRNNPPSYMTVGISGSGTNQRYSFIPLPPPQKQPPGKQ
ncbi:MAG: bifunctional serine/threonine-protein kinase/ABC transporter substrate-binding protein [Leptolyngbyaceae cyanobacterium bins.349]|nr:bifunctional serine/threonine-protein kinase/ABC transporter substrate-binding protein [Leptolyngbyaceae cyanobacterium bins.349]